MLVFVEIVYQGGTKKKQRKKISQLLILKLVNMFMVCLILNGKKSTRNNYFSLSLGNNSTKLQGLWFISNWCFNIPSHASVTPPDDPGKENTYFPFANTAQALDWIAEVPTVFKLSVLNTSPKPGICLSAISLTASGVIFFYINYLINNKLSTRFV